MVIYTNEHLTDLLNEQNVKIRNIEAINDKLIDLLQKSFLHITYQKEMSYEELLQLEEDIMTYSAFRRR